MNSFRGSNAGHQAYLARGRLKPGQLNKTETAYVAHLELLKHAGEILWYRPHGLKLRLADNTFYTPDVAVLAADMVMECHEVKGGIWEDDARAKIKIAADLYPFRFKAIKARAKKHGGGWEEEDFSRSTSEERKCADNAVKHQAAASVSPG